MSDQKTGLLARALEFAEKVWSNMTSHSVITKAVIAEAVTKTMQEDGGPEYKCPLMFNAPELDMTTTGGHTKTKMTLRDCVQAECAWWTDRGCVIPQCTAGAMLTHSIEPQPIYIPKEVADRIGITKDGTGTPPDRLELSNQCSTKEPSIKNFPQVKTVKILKAGRDELRERGFNEEQIQSVEQGLNEAARGKTEALDMDRLADDDPDVVDDSAKKSDGHIDLSETGGEASAVEAGEILNDFCPKCGRVLCKTESGAVVCTNIGCQFRRV